MTLASLGLDPMKQSDRSDLPPVLANARTVEIGEMSENKAWAQLCLFHLHSGKSDEFMGLFKDRIINLFRRHGAYIAENAGVLGKHENTESSYLLIIGWPSAEAGPNVWKALDFDEEWISIRHGLESGGILKRLENQYASKNLDSDAVETK